MCVCVLCGDLNNGKIFFLAYDFEFGDQIIVAHVSFLQSIKESGRGPAHTGL